MARIHRSTRNRVGRAALLGAALVAASASPAAALPSPQAKHCKKPSGVVASKYGNYAFVKGRSLWACTAYYGDAPKTFRLGPWSKGFSRISFDGSTAIWTVAGPVFEGAPADRIWAADAPAGRAWIKGVRPSTAPIEDLDQTVASLHATGEAVGWVTTGGTVMMGVEDPQSDPAPIGSGTPAATVAPVLGVPQGLLEPLTPKGRRLLVGRWSTPVTPQDLGASMQIVAGEGDGDECGGAGPWRLTVKPLADQAAVGATWDSAWTSTSDGCRGL